MACLCRFQGYSHIYWPSAQPGNAKFCCFLCLWDSRARTEHYVRKHWPTRDEIEQEKQHQAKTTSAK